MTDTYDISLLVISDDTMIQHKRPLMRTGIQISLSKKRSP